MPTTGPPSEMGSFSFSVWDYLIIVATFSVSALIGLFFALDGDGQKTSEEYFLGNRKMNVIPVILSTTVTVMSAINYMGLPGEIYLLGPQYWLMFASKFVCCYLTTSFFLPVFYRLRVISVYEYYDKRFNVTVRYCILLAEYVHATILCGVVIYVPSLALSTITGLNLTFLIIAVGIVCTFYTTIGGFKAVVWTDVFQAAVMLVGLLLMIVVGTVRAGGVAEGWRRAKEGQRANLVDFNFDPTVRYTFWTIMVGGSLFYTMVNSTKQPLIQRYNSCKTETQAKAVAWFGILGMGVAELLVVVTGMVIYAYYAYCDPLSSGKISSPDQLVAFYMIDLFRDTPGLSGVAIAGAFCASLSSISSVVNSLATITGETIIKNHWTDLPEKTYTLWVKVISACLGASCTCAALLASSIGGVIQIILSLGGIFGGPGLGVISLGIFVPRADARSALCGLLTAIAICLTLEIGSRVTGSRAQPSLPSSVEGCDAMLNVTYSPDTTTTSYIDMITAAAPSHAYEDDFISRRIPVFAISTLHYSTISTFVTILVGILVSYLPGNKGPEACDPTFLTPMVQRYYLKTYRSSGRGEPDAINEKYDEVPFEMGKFEQNC